MHNGFLLLFYNIPSGATMSDATQLPVTDATAKRKLQEKRDEDIRQAFIKTRTAESDLAKKGQGFLDRQEKQVKEEKGFLMSAIENPYVKAAARHVPVVGPALAAGSTMVNTYQAGKALLDGDMDKAKNEGVQGAIRGIGAYANIKLGEDNGFLGAAAGVAVQVATEKIADQIAEVGPGKQARPGGPTKVQEIYQQVMGNHGHKDDDTEKQAVVHAPRPR
jgi:hypothetical protein